MDQNKENQKQEEKEEECSLCKVSEETIKRLKEKPTKEPKTAPPKKSSGKLKVWLLILVFAAAGFVFYQFSLQPSQQLTREENPIQEQVQEQSKEENRDQEQPEEENKTNILDIFPRSLKAGDLAPDFVLEDVYGNETSLSNFRGKSPVLLVFWATWCGYCAKELPDLKAFTQEHQNEIQIIAVSGGESKETIKNYIQEKNINFIILLDEGRKIWNQYSIRGTPSHFFVSSQGKIVALRPGLTLKEDFETIMTMLTDL